MCNTPQGNSDQEICDMAGNLLEWVQDEWHSDYNGAPNNGSGWCTGGCPVNASDPNYDAGNLRHRLLLGGSHKYKRNASPL